MSWILVTDCFLHSEMYDYINYFNCYCIYSLMKHVETEFNNRQKLCINFIFSIDKLLYRLLICSPCDFRTSLKNALKTPNQICPKVTPKNENNLLFGQSPSHLLHLCGSCSSTWYPLGHSTEHSRYSMPSLLNATAFIVAEMFLHASRVTQRRS